MIALLGIGLVLGAHGSATTDPRDRELGAITVQKCTCPSGARGQSALVRNFADQQFF